MKRCTITTLTIALVSLVIMLIATHVAQYMAAKEGFAGGGIPAKFFSGASMKKGGGPNYKIDPNAKTDDGQPIFDVPLAKPLDGETNEDFYKRLGTIKKGWRSYNFATFEDNTWYDLYYESGGNEHPVGAGLGANHNLVEHGLSLPGENFKQWDRKYPLKIVLDYVRNDGTKYSSTYYFYDGIFTYDWPPPSTPAPSVYDPDTRERPPASVDPASAAAFDPQGSAADPSNWTEAREIIPADNMNQMGMGMGGPGIGGPGGRRPIVINVNNTGGAYAPQGAMEQQLAPKNFQITHELSEDSEEKLTKTMNFMEFVVKKSQN